jgi:alkyl hydroperoxide reductase subunit AhpC
MAEQAKNSDEISAATSDLDQQTKEASRAMKEQAVSFKQIADGSGNVTKQVKLIAAANLENSRSTVIILKRIQEVRDVSIQNGESARNIERVLEKTSVATSKKQKAAGNAGKSNTNGGARA